MKKNTKDIILDIIKENEQITINNLVEIISLSRQIVHRHISSLLEKGLIKKEGNPPKVFYSLKDIEKNKIKHVFEPKAEKIIRKNFFLIDPTGTRFEGVDAFVYWCTKRGFDIEQKSKEYVETFNKFEAYRKDGLISGMYKMKHTFKETYLDEIMYLDFYSIEVFGKTKLGQMMLYAKQSQSKKLIRELVEIIKPTIQKLIKDKKIDAVGFIPPTIKREVQFMKEIEKGLDLKLFKINLSKIKGEYLVPQKTLSKLEDRIENAKQIKLLAIFSKDRDKNPDFKKVLLIDDALGSGATLNEVARQIKSMNISKEVIGLAITGSFSGFEIISEV